jgi:predicted PurR-regulated permease PerM
MSLRDWRFRATSPEPDRALLWREARLLGVLALVVAAAAVFVLAVGVFLLAFAAVLVAVVLNDPSRWLADHAHLPYGLALGLVSAVMAGVLGVLGWYAAPHVVDQLAQFAERVPTALAAMDAWLTRWLGVDASLQVRDALPSPESLLGALPNIVTTTFGILASLLVVIVVGVYFAVYPEVYRDGLVRLFPTARREGLRTTLDETGTMLRRWMRGQLITMVLIGVLAYVTLRLLGVPLALGLALLTALLEFVPYIGPIAAAVPVVLVAFTESWSLALYALAAYTAIQMVEGNLLVPLIQERAIALPPALIILCQVLFGVLFGVLGIVLATPLIAAIAVLVRRSYVDLLEEETAPPPAPPTAESPGQQPAVLGRGDG